MRRRVIIKQGALALTAMISTLPLTAFNTIHVMTSNKKFDVIIIGGSYAGLSAAMALGRSLRDVLIIDSGLPCNRQTPHSHNFITQDGEKPREIARKATAQVLQYNTVQIHNDLAISGAKTNDGFSITTKKGEEFKASKLIFATGVKDIMPDIKGFSQCWGISAIHCPYCHGYEVKHKKTGIIANGDVTFHYAQLIRNWTTDLTIFTNGTSTLTREQHDKIKRHNISIIEKEISQLQHDHGQIEQLVFKDNTTFELDAIYARPEIEQHCDIPAMLGCELTEQKLIKVDEFQKTTVGGVFACGDNSSLFRAVSKAVAAGNMAGAIMNNQMTEAAFT
nr:FAD-dependent pyridine nucleotide-disulfide oxidoreductase [Dokdonia sp. PRO95]